jgi:hypothetical protein
VIIFYFFCVFEKFAIQRKKEICIMGPKMTTWRGVIRPRDSLLPGRRGREQREPRERSRRGKGLNTPQWDLRMIWLVRILWVMLIGGWGRRRVQLDLRLDREPGKQKLKGAVRIETYRRHYWQHSSSLFCLLRGLQSPNS